MKAILDLLFPRRCPVCGEIVRPAGSLICLSCLPELSFTTPPVCKKCGKEIADETVEYCRDCMARPHTFEYGVALLNYNEAARRSVSQIKYNNKREYLDFYGKALAARYAGTIARMSVDAIVPVPVHPSRKRRRGFNQAEVLAQILGKYLNIPVSPDLLIRTRKTHPQKDLTPRERLSNLKGAFTAPPIPPSIRSVLLIDDIYTTGSTIEACTCTLKTAGIRHVYFAVICTAGGR